MYDIGGHIAHNFGGNFTPAKHMLPLGILVEKCSIWSKHLKIISDEIDPNLNKNNFLIIFDSDAL